MKPNKTEERLEKIEARIVCASYDISDLNDAVKRLKARLDETFWDKHGHWFMGFGLTAVLSGALYGFSLAFKHSSELGAACVIGLLVLGGGIFFSQIFKG